MLPVNLPLYVYINAGIHNCRWHDTVCPQGVAYIRGTLNTHLIHSSEISDECIKNTLCFDFYICYD